MKIDIIEPAIFSKDRIKAGVTKRNLDQFPPFGMTFTSSDKCPAETVQSHIQTLADHLGVSSHDMKFQNQVHGIRIRKIDNTSIQEESDGMITNTKEIFLCVKIADCCAILVYDPVNEAIGAFHSGWRGTKENIANSGIKAMTGNFGTDPENIFVYLSPCASGEEYEIGPDVAVYFPKSTTPVGNGKYLFDNRKEILSQLHDLGVKKEHIEVSPVCTIKNHDFHSYRRDKENSGRMCAFISLCSPSVNSS